MTAKKKTNRRNTTKSIKKKFADLKRSLFSVALGMSILILLIAAAGILTHRMMLRRQPAAPVQPLIKVPAKDIPVYEVYPKEPVVPLKPAPEPKPEPEPVPTPRPYLPKVAIIVDDIGYDPAMAKKFLKLDLSLTLSILPDSPFEKSIAQIARERGSEIMLHLPMEPKEYPDVQPGPGALLNAMSPEELIRQLEADLDEIPDIKGVNNHMGSRMTADSERMHQIFSVLKKRNLYFIDSRTAPESICKPSARLFRVPFSERDVFIDHYQDEKSIRHQIELMIKIAEKKGSSIGIAHPHELTFRVLSDMLPEIKGRAEIVPASGVLETGG